MQFSVYILFSKSSHAYYTGQAQDIEARLIRHNAGETVSIKRCVPWILIWKTEVQTRSEAMKLEKKIKSRGASRFLSGLGIHV